MAQVDFSNAHIEPCNTNPIVYTDLNFTSTVVHLEDASRNYLTSNFNTSTLKNESDEWIIRYASTFTASGTEFYIGIAGTTPSWKVTGITFNSGDTFDFSIKANII